MWARRAGSFEDKFTEKVRNDIRFYDVFCSCKETNMPVKTAVDENVGETKRGWCQSLDFYGPVPSGVPP